MASFVLGFFENLPSLVACFHELQLGGLVFVDFLLIALDFGADGAKFFVFASFELLGFEAPDGGSAGFDVQLDRFDGDLVFLQAGFGVGDGLLRAGEPGLGHFLFGGNAFEVRFEVRDGLVALLEDEKFLDFGNHAL